MWTILLGILGKLIGYFTRVDERDQERAAGEKSGVTEVQAATAQHAVQEARDAHQIDEDVRRSSDAELDNELRQP